MVKTNKYLDW